MSEAPLDVVEHWLRDNPGIFGYQRDGDELLVLELHSSKQRALRKSEVERAERMSNAVDARQSYVAVLLDTGAQLVLSPQGFAFAPDFSNTGPVELPSQVLCLRDHEHLMTNLQVLAEDPARRREALQLVMLLIALLDGATAVGLGVEREIEAVHQILEGLESDTLPPA